ncbi:MAG: ribonuclease J [Syntrophobacterales bacterium]|nr:ribonuclease J [Syntrophobacterales bacterium]
MTNQSRSSTPPVKLIPLGGLGEIGLNMMVVEYEDTIVLIDAGLMFPEEEMFGIDIVIPDFSYLRDHLNKLKALIVTHGHEDHIGAIPFLVQEFPIAIYGTSFTLALIKEKLVEHNLLGKVSLHKIEPKIPFLIDPFVIEPFRVCHSIPDGVGLIISTPVGVIVHSGDFKIDHTPIDGKPLDFARLSTYAEKGVLLLLSDSTNVEREGYTLSEKDVGKTFRDIFQTAPGRIIIAVFASNIHRIQQAVYTARQFGRKILFHGKSIQTNVRLAEELGYLEVLPEDKISLKDLPFMPDHRVVIITTGSQGEPMSALTRIAFDDHKWIKLKKGDTVILSSKFIPGNERTIHNVINNLYRRGARVIYESVEAIHVSGHAHREELKWLIGLVRPKFFIPIHGEYRHLVKHCELAKEMGIPQENCFLVEDGDVVSLWEDWAVVSSKISSGRVFVDGKGVGDVGGPVLRDRKHLAEDGLVIVSLVIDQEYRGILSGPDVFSRGFISDEMSSDIIYCAQCLTLEIFDRYLEQGITPDTGEIQREIRKELKKFFLKILGRRPLIYPIIMEV